MTKENKQVKVEPKNQTADIKAVRSIRFLFFIAGLGGLALGLSGIIDFKLNASVAALKLILFGLTAATIFFVTGYYLAKFKRWARILAFLLAILMLFNFPIGTIAGVVILYYLRKAAYLYKN